MAIPEPRTDGWHDPVREKIPDPVRPLVDPHHHLSGMQSM